MNERCENILMRFNWLFILLFYILWYYFAVYIFRDYYYDKSIPKGYKPENYYCIPIDSWLKHWYFRILLWKSSELEIYSKSETGGILYVKYREMQCTIVLRVTLIPFLIADVVLLIYQNQFSNMCEFYYPIWQYCVLWFPLWQYLIENIFAYPVMKHDYKRMKSYRYVVANADEAILSDARRNPPALWKLNTLLDVFFYFGEARIRCCESGNYLVYRLKNGDLLYIFLKEFFETMPEAHYEPDELNNWRRHNPAIGILIDEIIVFDGNMQNDDQLLTMKNIKPQDMPENIC